MTTKVATIRITINVTNDMLDGLAVALNTDRVGTLLLKAYLTDKVYRHAEALGAVGRKKRNANIQSG